MKTQKRFSIDKFLLSCFMTLFFLSMPTVLLAFPVMQAIVNQTEENYTEYKGIVVDRKSGSPLAFASLVVVGTNISTVTNAEGQFSLKIAKELSNAKIVVSFLGYKNKAVTLADINPNKPRIELEPISVELPEISVISKDAEALILAVLAKKGENYSNEQTLMTAFYRETIKKNRAYVSLSEAVVEVYKQPYLSYKTDIAKLYKARKKVDYNKLDTVTFKLMGGPFNSLYLDIMKNPEMIFTENMLSNYEFTFDRSMHTDNRLIYVIDFKQREGKIEPLYFGKIYIDAKSLAMKSAVFNLNIKNREMASQMFIKKKPFNANVYPTEATYRIDYLEKDGKWYYGFSRIELGLKINWKKKLFNTTYFSTIEMAVTDWKPNTENVTVSPKERLRPSVVISEEASGFSDPDFWGEYNVIEPEKSIESAIKKIQKQLEKKK
ncbi:MAG TPA: carboxypeptidase-like regulatory domain-containing protein [Paludibacter sp.]